MGQKESKGGKQSDQPCAGGVNAQPSQQAPQAASSSAPVKQPAPKLGLPSLPRAADGWALPARYEVKKSIGKGSYGSVSECFDKEKNQLVAVKQLKGLFDDLVDCKRILRELAILTKLDSNSVVRVHDVVIPQEINIFNELYIVLEICDSDMKKLVRTDVSLSALHINTLLYNLLVGLKYIHSAGVYHRDLKPANCLVNQNCSVKICDFGLARAIGGEGIDGRVSEEEYSAEESEAHHGHPVVPSTQKRKRAMTQHVVTRWYRAPEVILLQHGYTEAIDIWSVGCIYAELLQMQDDSIRFSDRGPVFPGSSCFPLSPERRKAGQSKSRSRGKNDQLEMIFSVLGTPTEQEAASLESEDARRYVKGFPASKGEGLASRLPRVGPEAVDILNKMLRFAPKDRIGVQQALEHPLLAGLRDPAAETTASGLVKLDFEKEDLKEAGLRHYFGVEMKKFHDAEAACNSSM